MKKILGGILIVLLVLGLGLYLTLHYFLGSIAKAGVNKFGPGITQTKVELQDAKISPISGVGTLSGFTVGNPAGWSTADAFRLGRIHLDVEPMSLFKDHIVINELIIEQPEFNYETKIVASNVGDLLKNIEASGTKKNQPTGEQGKPIKMVIKKLRLEGGKVTIGMGPTAIPLPMPPLVMSDIGVAEGGITPAQVAYAIMANVTTSVVAATTGGMSQLGGTTGAAAVETAKQAGEAIKGFFGGAKKPAATPPPTATK